MNPRDSPPAPQNRSRNVRPVAGTALSSNRMLAPSLQALHSLQKDISTVIDEIVRGRRSSGPAPDGSGSVGSSAFRKKTAGPTRCSGHRALAGAPWRVLRPMRPRHRAGGVRHHACARNRPPGSRPTRCSATFVDTHGAARLSPRRYAGRHESSAARLRLASAASRCVPVACQGLTGSSSKKAARPMPSWCAHPMRMRSPAKRRWPSSGRRQADSSPSSMTRRSRPALTPSTTITVQPTRQRRQMKSIFLRKASRRGTFPRSLSSAW